MTEIDYEQLAKAVWDAYTGYVTRIPWESAGPFKEEGSRAQARAVVAALRDQGFVVLMREPLRGLVEALEQDRPYFPPYLEEARAALAAAPGSEGASDE